MRSALRVKLQQKLTFHVKFETLNKKNETFPRSKTALNKNTYFDMKYTVFRLKTNNALTETK